MTVAPQPANCDPSSNKNQLDDRADQHFAPMLSTLDMQPKVVLTRTPVKSSSSPTKRGRGAKSAHSPRRLLAEAEKLLRGPHVRLEKLDYPTPSDVPLLARHKGFDHLLVRPPTTTVHMVQLPNPPLPTSTSSPTNSETGRHSLSSSNGLLSSSASNNNGTSSTTAGARADEQAGKDSSSTTSSTTTTTANAENSSSLVPPSIQQTDAVTTTTTTLTGATDPVQQSPLPPPSPHNPAVTLLSTPSVSIFQVAGRPASIGSSVISAPVGGFINPPPNPRARFPSSTPASPIRAPSSGSDITLAQLLAQSPGVGSESPAQQHQSTQLQQQQQPSPPPQQQRNGPPSGSSKPSRAAAARASRRSREDSVATAASASVLAGGESGSLSVAGVTPLDRVPLVKYVDLDMVSSPTRPRPGSVGTGAASATGVGRRHSHGGSSNSNSPDPHRYTGSAKSQRGTTNNPSSPAMTLLNSPQSPAAHLVHQAPPSPLSFRKSQPGSNKSAAQPSPSHPTQCPSPFSRPSSRSQDASPSSSEGLAGSMFPPGLVPFGSATVDTVSFSAGGRFSGASSPSSGSSGGGSSQSTGLPKFGMAFGKNKGHFDPTPILSPPGQPVSASPLLAGSPLREPALQAVMSSGSNGFVEADRRFAAVASASSGDGLQSHHLLHNPPAEDEGLGSKLQSLLESALNGQISRSPTRGLLSGSHLHNPQHHMHHLQHAPPGSSLVSNPALLSDSSAHNSPLGDGQAAGGPSASSGSSLLELELREFESVFQRVASTSGSSNNNNSSSATSTGHPPPWTDLHHHHHHDHDPHHDHDHVSAVPVEFPAPLSASGFSGAEESPSPSTPAEPPPPQMQPDRPTSSSRSSDEAMLSGSTTAAEAQAPPLMQQLLTVASAARQALEEEEGKTAVPVSEQSSMNGTTTVVKEEPADDSSSTAGLPQVAAVLIPSPPATTALPLLQQQQACGRVLVQLPTATVVVVSAPPSTAEPAQLSHPQQSISVTTNLTKATTTTTSTTTAVTARSGRSSKTPAVSPASAPGIAATSASATSASTTSTSTAPVAVSSSSGNSSPSKTSTVAANSAAGTNAAASNKAPQKAHDDEHTVLRVQAILEEYKEQLRNSPDLQNKPAPRRRSNPLPSPAAAPKRRKSGQSKVKLLSQHLGRTGPVEAVSTGGTTSTTTTVAPGAAGDGTPTTTGLEPVTAVAQLADAHQTAIVPVKVEVKAESVEKVAVGPEESSPTASVQILNAAPLQLSMVTTNRAATDIQQQQQQQQSVTSSGYYCYSYVMVMSG